MSLARSIPSSDPFDLARRRFLERLPEHFQRLTWSPEQVVEHQTAALRHLLRVAAARSPFHADRLAAVAADIDAFSPSDLCALPVMTKADMMADYDDVVTDRRLTSARVDAFIAVQGESPGTLFDE